MKLEHVLKRIGVTVVSTEKRQNGSVQLLLRLAKTTQTLNPATLWAVTINEFLLAGAEKQANGQLKVSWRADVSKYFYPKADAGVVVFLWRVILMDDVPGAGEALGQAAIRALAQTVTVKSMPLVGRATYEHDPKRGKIKGAYATGEGGGTDVAASLISSGGS